MLSEELLLKVLYWHIIPSMTTVILTSSFIRWVVRVFHVRNPRWQYWLFLVPLAKGFIVLTTGVQSPPAVLSTKPFVFGIRLWDPLNIISIPSAFRVFPPGAPSVIDLITIGALFILVLAFIWRWVSLFSFYKSLGGEDLYAEDAPRLFQLLDQLVDAMGTRHPKVIVSDKPYILPCLVGLFKPTIVLPPELVEGSSDDILEAVLAHELAHLKRRDNIFHWISVILRDTLTLNPFVYSVYSKILIAKEQDCDRIAAGVTGKPKAMAEAITYAALLASRKGIKPLPGYMSETRESISAGRLINQRVDMLLVSSGGREQKIYWAKVLVLAILVLFSFFIHIRATRPYPFLFLVIQF